MANIGKYELLYQLGTGSMGTVYRALDTVLEREVALKTLRQAPFTDGSMTERFYREAKAAARLQHPNIVTIFELGHSGETLFIAMELLTGSNLRCFLGDSAALDPGSKLEIMAQVCEGLAHAHRAGIVHRDIKPSNIFRTNENTAKILDFGIARMPASALTLSGSVLGTPDYMSPEQIGGKRVDGRSDLFSAAIVLFELLTGVHPFRASSIPRRIVSGPPERLRDINGSFPDRLDQFFRKALAAEPEDRMESGDLMAAELREAAHELFAMQAEPVNGMAVTFSPNEEREPIGRNEEESSEWRISEFLRLLPEFDEALESGKLDMARQSLQSMRLLEAEDERFAVAVLEYEGRLRGAERISTRVTTVTGFARAALAIPERGPEERAWLVEPAAPMPEEAAYSGLPTVAEAHATDLSSPPAGYMEVPLRGMAEPRRNTPARNRLFALKTRTERALASVAAMAALVLLAGSIASLMLNEGKPTVPSPALGTATVQGPSALVYFGPAKSGGVIQSLHKNERVNVLGGGNGSRHWVRVQVVSGASGGRPGYVNAADLGGWSTFRALRTIQPANDADRPERIAYLEQVNRYMEAHPKNADTGEAGIEAASQNVALAETARSEGAAPQEVQGYVENASKILGKIGNAPDLPGKASSERVLIEGLRKSLTMLQRGEAGISQSQISPQLISSGATETNAVATTPVAYDAVADVHRATAAWQNGDYARARRYLRRVLRFDPHNDEAKDLLDKVGRAQAVDPGVSQ